MSTDTVIRVLSLCVVLAGTETLHGIARTVLLVPRVGKALALKLSIVSGSLLAFAVCYLLVPGIGLATIEEHLLLGLCLALFMAAFDLAMGRLLLRRSWSKALQDFNPATGNLLVVGLGLLVLFPALVALLRAGH
ncbi:hypothetical protein [uncultured Piscinibacter sp.]|uniref:hypothetical protein n=1 Tax=uncultured Piscinibacter sp. TaxID=1131835 RepID=UPI0026209432|nr:hypothetical protein [uncultured Piscinibacter sp.]